MSKRTGIRPSQILGIDYEWAALDIDAAVGSFGEYVEGEMDRAVQRLYTRRQGSKGRSSVTAEERRRKRDEAWHRVVMLQRKRTYLSLSTGRPFVHTRPLEGRATLV